MSKRATGTLIIIGGHEDRSTEGKCDILKAVVQAGKGGKLVLVTVATQHPEEVAAEYLHTFAGLGVPQVDVLDIRERAEAMDPANLAKLDGATAVFFTGGDQLRITSQLGDSAVMRRMQEIYLSGGTIAGTSAGAAAMPETMLISGHGDESHERGALGMAPGLGFMTGVITDSHFAQRGRMGRLIGAVTQNPANLGLGIDEDTAIVVRRGESFRVLGSGAVYVLDGTGITYSSLSEQSEGIVTVCDLRLHVLGDGQGFDLRTARPIIGEAGGAGGKKKE